MDNVIRDITIKHAASTNIKSEVLELFTSITDAVVLHNMFEIVTLERFCLSVIRVIVVHGKNVIIKCVGVSLQEAYLKYITPNIAGEIVYANYSHCVDLSDMLVFCKYHTDLLNALCKKDHHELFRIHVHRINDLPIVEKIATTACKYDAVNIMRCIMDSFDISTMTNNLVRIANNSSAIKVLRLLQPTLYNGIFNCISYRIFCTNFENANSSIYDDIM